MLAEVVNFKNQSGTEESAVRYRKNGLCSWKWVKDVNSGDYPALYPPSTAATIANSYRQNGR